MITYHDDYNITGKILKLISISYFKQNSASAKRIIKSFFVILMLQKQFFGIKSVIV